MLPEERRRKLLGHVSVGGSANVAELCVSLNVSPATVRRDLQLLEERGLLMRTHGGAVSSSNAIFEPPHSDKQLMRIAEKLAIARYASTLIRHGDTVVLDSGSTIFALAQCLKDKQGLTVITTDLKVALELSDAPSIDVIISGGRVRSRLYTVIGPLAEESLKRFHAHIAFLGADAIHQRRGVTNASVDEVFVKRQVLAAGQRKVLLADHSKFGQVSLAKVCDLEDFDEVITDMGLLDHELKDYRDFDCRVIRVGRES